MIETPIVWDGGSLLPGETSPVIAATTRLPSRSQLSEATSDPETVEAEAAEAEEAEAETEKQFEAAEQAESEAAEEETSAIVGHAAEPTVEAEPVAEIEHIEDVSVDNVAAIAEETEPHTASASYRVDPSAPSEYRVTAPVEDAEVEGHSIQAAEETETEPAAEVAAGS